MAPRLALCPKRKWRQAPVRDPLLLRSLPLTNMAPASPPPPPTPCTMRRRNDWAPENKMAAARDPAHPPLTLDPAPPPPRPTPSNFGFGASQAGLKKMASRRQTLRCKVSVCPPEGEAQLDKKPKTQPPTDALQRIRFTRSTSKKAEEASKRETLHCKDSDCPLEGEAQLDEKPKIQASERETLHCKVSDCPPEGEAQLEEKPKIEDSERETLHCKVSDCPPEGEAQLNEKPKKQPPIDPLQRIRFTRSTSKKVAEPPIDPLQRIRFTRSTSKKVAETPSQPSGCSNGAPTMPSFVEIQETCRRQLRRRLVNIPLCENSKMSAEKSPRSSSGVSATQKSPQNDLWQMSTAPCEKPSQNDEFEGGNSEPKENEELPQMRCTEATGTESEKVREAEKATSRKPQLVRGTQKSPQKRDRFGHWLPRVNSGKLDTKVKGKLDTKAKGKQDADVKCNANEENSLVQQIEAPGIEPERTEELQKPTRRKSLRVANQQSVLEKSCSTINTEHICPEHNGSKPEEHVDTNCGPDVTEQSELQTSGLNRRGKEELEVTKAKQDNMEMDKKEDKIFEQLPCDTASCVVLEQGSLLLEDTCGSSTQSASKSAQEEGPLVAVPKINFANKEVQTVSWNPIVVTAEELKVEDLETEEQLLVEDSSPKESQKDVVKETPPFEPAHSNLGDGTKPGAVQSEVDMEGVSADPLTVGEERTSEMMVKQEMDKAEIPEADEKVEGVNDQAEAIATKVDQEAEEQNLEKSEVTPKSALQLIVSNLDSSKNFGELQIAVISFFMERKLSVTSISMKKSRKRGQVTFLSGKDVSRALKYNGEQLLGRALRLRRPPQIQKPVAIVRGRKRKLKESDLGATISPPAKKKNVQKTTVLTKRKKKEPMSLLKKKKKKVQEQTASNEKSEEEEKEFITPSLKQQQKRKQEKLVLSEKSKEDEWKDKLPGVKKKIAEKHTLSEKREGETAPLLQKKKKKKHQEKAASNEKSEEEEKEFITLLLQQQQKRKQEKHTLSEKREGETAPLLQKKKKKKNQEKEVILSEKRVEEGEKVASVLKKKKSKEKIVLSTIRAEKDTARPKKKKKKQEISSWCLCIQKVRSQEALSELKTAVANFLNERSVAYKEIVLYPDSCSACVELSCEDDLNEALQFDPCKIIGEAARLSKVEKLGAIVDGSDPRTLPMKSLPSEVCAKDLKNLFERVAGIWIQECQQINKRFAFVAFETAEAAANALSKGEVECQGKLIQLTRACQKSKGKRKILMVKNLPYPLSKKYLKSVFNNAEDVRVSKDNQSQRIVYIEYKTVKQAKVALKEFKGKSLPGEAIRVAAIEERKESPESKSDGHGPTSSLFIRGLSTKTTAGTLKSTFKGAVNARLPQNAAKRFAYVDFKTAEEAARTRVEMQNVEIDGHKVKLYFANSTQRGEEAVRNPHVI
ncbi:uncharacterized protein LOC121272247 [Carcharodon carcharias]|uniref:uncharacterized protein LOC121272247 n=1 Tax=Carcharodon carcharias TaxID=13397 RepID=UPI001B7EC1CA|nr:uncharacterized protein LOC121272247 [Carcharodon carcharias]